MRRSISRPEIPTRWLGPDRRWGRRRRIFAAPLQDPKIGAHLKDFPRIIVSPLLLPNRRNSFVNAPSLDNKYDPAGGLSTNSHSLSSRGKITINPQSETKLSSSPSKERVFHFNAQILPVLVCGWGHGFHSVILLCISRDLRVNPMVGKEEFVHSRWEGEKQPLLNCCMRDKKSLW